MNDLLRAQLTAIAAGTNDQHPATLAANIATLAAAILALAPAPIEAATVATVATSGEASSGNDQAGGAAPASLAGDATTSASDTPGSATSGSGETEGPLSPALQECGGATPAGKLRALADYLDADGRALWARDLRIIAAAIPEWIRDTLGKAYSELPEAQRTAIVASVDAETQKGIVTFLQSALSA